MIVRILTFLLAFLQVVFYYSLYSSSPLYIREIDKIDPSFIIRSLWAFTIIFVLGFTSQNLIIKNKTIVEIETLFFLIVLFPFLISISHYLNIFVNIEFSVYLCTLYLTLMSLSWLNSPLLFVKKKLYKLNWHLDICLSLYLLFSTFGLISSLQPLLNNTSVFVTSLLMIVLGCLTLVFNYYVNTKSFVLILTLFLISILISSGQKSYDEVFIIAGLTLLSNLVLALILNKYKHLDKDPKAWLKFC